MGVVSCYDDKLMKNYPSELADEIKDARELGYGLAPIEKGRLRQTEYILRAVAHLATCYRGAEKKEEK